VNSAFLPGEGLIFRIIGTTQSAHALSRITQSSQSMIMALNYKPPLTPVVKPELPKNTENIAALGYFRNGHYTSFQFVWITNKQESNVGSG